MTNALKNSLLDQDNRDDVVKDFHQLIDAEVSRKSGVSGLAIKGGYGMINKINDRLVPDAVDGLLDAAVTKLEPFYADFASDDSESLPEYFESRSDEIATALVEVTDERAEQSQRDSVKKIYNKLRPNAHKNVEEAVPSVAKVIEKYVS